MAQSRGRGARLRRTFPPAGYRHANRPSSGTHGEPTRKSAPRPIWKRRLRYRPDWAEGPAIRLGIVLLSRYRSAVATLLTDRGSDAVRASALSDPLRLHDVIRTAASRGSRRGRWWRAGSRRLVRRDLVPAAPWLPLEARRCCPVWGLPHAELATLDYLLPGGEPTSVHARRALRLAGPGRNNRCPGRAEGGRAGRPDLRLARHSAHGGGCSRPTERTGSRSPPLARQVAQPRTDPRPGSSHRRSIRRPLRRQALPGPCRPLQPRSVPATHGPWSGFAQAITDWARPIDSPTRPKRRPALANPTSPPSK